MQIQTTKKIEQALSLREEAEQYGRFLLDLRNSEVDGAHRVDRVKVSRVEMPERVGHYLSGAARFELNGGLKTLGIRQTEPGSSAAVEIKVRQVRNKVSIVKKTFLPSQRNTAIVATAVFRLNGEVIRYQEVTR